MKTNVSLLRHLAAIAALLLPAATLPSFAQTTATTDPVGFLTMNINGGGSASAPVYTFTTLGLMNPVAFQSTTTSVGGSATLADSTATWTDNQYNSTTAGAPPTNFVEIVSGPGAGTTYDITATNAAAKSLTLDGPLLAAITSGASYKIRPHWTIASVFGATNQGGLGAGSVVSADQIQLFRNAGYVSYYYQTSGFGGTGWRKGGAPTVDASANVIYADDGILIQRLQSAPVSLVISGAVKTGQTSLPVLTGYSLLGNVYAAGMTLADSGLYTTDPTTGLAGGSVVSADQVMFWNAAGTGFDNYYYQTSGFGGTGWRKSGAPTVDASPTPIPVGAAVFIQRIGAAFNWIAPQHPTTF